MCKPIILLFTAKYVQIFTQDLSKAGEEWVQLGNTLKSP